MPTNGRGAATLGAPQSAGAGTSNQTAASHWASELFDHKFLSQLFAYPLRGLGDAYNNITKGVDVIQSSIKMGVTIIAMIGGSASVYFLPGFGTWLAGILTSSLGEAIAGSWLGLGMEVYAGGLLVGGAIKFLVVNTMRLINGCVYGDPDYFLDKHDVDRLCQAFGWEETEVRETANSLITAIRTKAALPGMDAVKGTEFYKEIFQRFREGDVTALEQALEIQNAVTETMISAEEQLAEVQRALEQLQALRSGAPLPHHRLHHDDLDDALEADEEMGLAGAGVGLGAGTGLRAGAGARTRASLHDDDDRPRTPESTVTLPLSSADLLAAAMEEGRAGVTAARARSEPISPRSDDRAAAAASFRAEADRERRSEASSTRAVASSPREVRIDIHAEGREEGEAGEIARQRWAMLRDVSRRLPRDAAGELESLDSATADIRSRDGAIDVDEMLRRVQDARAQMRHQIGRRQRRQVIVARRPPVSSRIGSHLRRRGSGLGMRPSASFTRPSVVELAEAAASSSMHSRRPATLDREDSAESDGDVREEASAIHGVAESSSSNDAARNSGAAGSGAVVIQMQAHLEVDEEEEEEGSPSSTPRSRHSNRST